MRESQKKISSSDEDICFNEDENNYARQTYTKLLPACPEIGNFVSKKKLHTQKSIENNSTNVLCQRSTSYSK